METTTTTTRFNGIITRNKRGLVRDLVSAVMLAGLFVGACGALRSAWHHGEGPAAMATETTATQAADGCMLVQVCPQTPSATVAN